MYFLIDLDSSVPTRQFKITFYHPPPPTHEGKTLQVYCGDKKMEESTKINTAEHLMLLKAERQFYH